MYIMGIDFLEKNMYIILSVTSWVNIGILEHDMGGDYQNAGSRKTALGRAQDTLYVNYIHT